MKDVETIDMGKLKEAIKGLNSFSGVVQKVKLVGVAKPKLVQNFIDAVNAIPEDVVNDLPAETILLYNELTEGEEIEPEPKKEEVKEEPVEAPVKEKKVEEKEKAPKKEKEKKEPKEKKPPKEKVTKELSKFQHTIGSQAALIDDLLTQGLTKTQMAEKSGLSINRITSHINHLEKSHNIEIVKDKETGVIQIKG